MVRMYGEG